ncbi:iron-sulfur cluster carrier protein ApbC [Acinetobacter rathckeae]|uniref:iron-sulfur cluster carrier protein ApbC n=1 Tax=Acinetobacter rathckeae TaxID=2605272 RepID=UPI0018A305F4|nr:iron-sulfur cluster carrier protein ApbC [Acinetobacter rathckeae]MBF7688632.1 iron-sulfur cluster carrier protein ApbC [Acinetobacter rathckeae]MBF7695878.1 iron-sulfur cluster carrier protein ApbC [Acinetobacter rathckeae]
MSWHGLLKSALGENHSHEQDIERVLQTFQLPSGQLLCDHIQQIQYVDACLQLMLDVPKADVVQLQTFRDELAEQLALYAVKHLNLHIIQQKTAAVETVIPQSNKTPPQQQTLTAHPMIEHVVVVASGKGGVGKSTTTVNLALALQSLGYKVGVLDADIYGPSIPIMLGSEAKSPVIENERFIPINAYGMAVLSIGHLLGKGNTPVAWRGPKATGALMQLFNQTLWPQLDILLIDLPPGTGDIQLTLAQRIPVTGAVVVTTPQNVALLDAVKGVELFKRVSIPVLGVVENMAMHVCSNCGHEEHIFGIGGGTHLADEYAVPLLGQLPLLKSIQQSADSGKPSVLVQDEAAPHYVNIAKNMLLELKKIPQRVRDKSRIF